MFVELAFFTMFQLFFDMLEHFQIVILYVGTRNNLLENLNIVKKKKRTKYR